MELFAKAGGSVLFPESVPVAMAAATTTRPTGTPPATLTPPDAELTWLMLTWHTSPLSRVFDVLKDILPDVSMVARAETLELFAMNAADSCLVNMCLEAQGFVRYLFAPVSSETDSITINVRVATVARLLKLAVSSDWLAMYVRRDDPTMLHVSTATRTSASVYSMRMLSLQLQEMHVNPGLAYDLSVRLCGSSLRDAVGKIKPLGKGDAQRCVAVWFDEGGLHVRGKTQVGFTEYAENNIAVAENAKLTKERTLFHVPQNLLAKITKAAIITPNVDMELWMRTTQGEERTIMLRYTVAFFGHVGFIVMDQGADTDPAIYACADST